LERQGKSERNYLLLLIENVRKKPSGEHARLPFMKVMLFLTLLLPTSLLLAQENLSAFETDFCTNYPEGPKDNPNQWKHCCLTHDMFFWAGGTRRDRDKADLELKSCIQKTGAEYQAQLMYLAVRAGSYSPVKYPKRQWNNGWQNRSSHQALTFEDIHLIENELGNGYEFISEEMKNKFINSLLIRLE
jgi:hypothetical protein